MTNLIKVELYKIKRQYVFYFLIIALMVVSAISSISAMNMQANLVGKIQYMEMFHDISILFVCAIAVAIYIGNDFQNRTIPFQIGTGQKRRNIFCAKLIISIGISQMLALVYIGIGTIIVTLNRGWGNVVTMTEIKDIFLILMESIILNIGTISCFVFFAFLCRDITKTICTSILFLILCSFLIPIVKYIPMLEVIVRFFTLTQISSIGITTISQLGVILCSSIFTFVVFSSLAMIGFQKAELKV